MRLCNIKLSGFKSFVDPTNLIIPGSLVGVVGPNGCGKSNIIDAVTWVMGESSAKHLRGESMTDVIFSGSSARQPVGQASVELVFDNSEKKLGGQYASYNEISVKRQINRDAVSTYFLNGTRCRRRDITAIFLGTGLGPRSYAIIEQGMISRLIDAKPEELRVYIEEAAGISKYRERRRETENRIKHTKENIERLTDIREELEKQLNHLQRQAKAAEKYKTFKEEQRKLSSELLALNWRDLNNEMSELKESAGKRENTVEAAIAKVRETEAEIEKQREGLSEANQHFNNMQSEFYKVGSDISSYEQKLQHTREKIATIESELEKVRQTHADTVRQHEQDKAEYEKLLAELNNLEPKLSGSRDESNKAYEILNQAEEAMQSWQAEWDAFNESYSEFTRQGQVDKTRLEHLEFGLEELAERRIQLEQEITKFEQSDLNNMIETLTKSLTSEEEKQRVLADDHVEKQNTVKDYREKVRTLSSQLNSARQEYQRLNGRLTSLETLQQSVLEDNQELTDWLKENDLDQQQRLSQSIKVNPKWTHALESVLGVHLHDICIEDLDSYINNLENAPGKFGLMNTSNSNVSSDVKPFPRLIEQITTDMRIPSLLENIYLADSTEEAMSMLSNLSAGQSIVTEKGMWLSHDWVMVNNASDVNDSVLNREEEICSLKAELEKRQNEIHSLEAELKTTEENLEQVESSLNEQQSLSTRQQQSISDIREKLASTQTQAEQQSIRHQEYLEELSENREQSESDKEEIDVIKQRKLSVDEDNKQFVQQREELSNVREKHRESLNAAKNSWQETHNESHGIALQVESYSSRRASYEQAIKRNDIQVTHLANRLSELEKNLSENQFPVKEIQEKIEACLKDKVHAEKNLGDARTSVQTIEAGMRELEQNRHKFEQDLEGLRADLEKARLGVNSCQVRLETVEGQLNAEDHDAKELLEAMEEGANQEDWTTQLEALERKITRLGPINLAAIDEFTQNSERKTYLDSQHKDLIDALSTLENAISKIDKETRTRFKETFDELNKNIKEMFPILFGGGHAYLELTGEDLLQTGVAIMARPPGKKNSSIHLLSGGEKALTAVSLVFSIFKLNPAPFCILDEVDAPLDDTNVGRFSNLVKSMSDEVQFIFITHNKITMEIANQLLGVTMHEAGVSRLVSVDMDEAVEMAATA
ncbi:MAG: chromosome segregation protein SMC [Proteobacteria bacterium]|nr:chromosome segregation protein SMC [Pseudomonadota bacterium]